MRNQNKINVIDNISQKFSKKTSFLTIADDLITPFSRKVILFTAGVESVKKQVNVTFVPSTPAVFPDRSTLVGTKE